MSWRSTNADRFKAARDGREKERERKKEGKGEREKETEREEDRLVDSVFWAVIAIQNRHEACRPYFDFTTYMSAAISNRMIPSESSERCLTGREMFTNVFT